MKREILAVGLVVMLVLSGLLVVVGGGAMDEESFDVSIEDTDSEDLKSGAQLTDLADSPWPSFGRDRRNTGLSPYDTSHVDGTEKWSFSTGGRHSSPAIGSDGTVYVGSVFDDNLYAVNPDGTEKWSFSTGDWVFSSPAIGSDGTVYVGSGDSNLYAVNPDGTEKWSFSTGGSVRSSPAIGSDGTVYVGSGGTVYVGSYDNKLYAIGEGDVETPSKSVKVQYYTPNLFSVSGSEGVEVDEIDKGDKTLSETTMQGYIFLPEEDIEYSFEPNVEWIKIPTRVKSEGLDVAFTILPEEDSGQKGEVLITGNDGTSYELTFHLEDGIDVTSTGFKLGRDGYSFRNDADMWSGGYCFGMAASSIVYYTEGNEVFPGEYHEDTYDLDWETSYPNIFAYQFSQMTWQIGKTYNDIYNNYDFLYNNIREDQPMLMSVMAGGQKHAVVGYRIIEYGDIAYIATYDPNIPVGGPWGDETDDTYARAYDNWFVYDKQTEESSYTGYTTYTTEEHNLKLQSMKPEPLSNHGKTLWQSIGGFRAGLNPRVWWEIGGDLVGAAPSSLRRGYDWTVDKTSWIFSCPIEVILVDSYGRKIGIVNGEIINEIDDADIHLIGGEIKHFILPTETEFSAVINGKDQGTYDLTIVSYDQESETAVGWEIREVDTDVGISDTLEVSSDLNVFNIVSDSDKTYYIEMAHVKVQEDPSFFELESRDIGDGQSHKYTVLSWEDFVDESVESIKLEMDTTGDGEYDETETFRGEEGEREDDYGFFPNYSWLIFLIVIIVVIVLAVVVKRGKKEPPIQQPAYPQQSYQQPPAYEQPYQQPPPPPPPPEEAWEEGSSEPPDYDEW